MAGRLSGVIQRITLAAASHPVVKYSKAGIEATLRDRGIPEKELFHVRTSMESPSSGKFSRKRYDCLLQILDSVPKHLAMTAHKAVMEQGLGPVHQLLTKEMKYDYNLVGQDKLRKGENPTHQIRADVLELINNYSAARVVNVLGTINDYRAYEEFPLSHRAVLLMKRTSPEEINTVLGHDGKVRQSILRAIDSEEAIKSFKTMHGIISKTPQESNRQFIRQLVSETHAFTPVVNMLKRKDRQGILNLLKTNEGSLYYNFNIINDALSGANAAKRRQTIKMMKKYGITEGILKVNPYAALSCRTC